MILKLPELLLSILNEEADPNDFGGIQLAFEMKIVFMVKELENFR